MLREENAKQNDNIQERNKFSKNVAMSKYVGTTATNQELHA
jgi:hypothetical protein